MAQERIRKKLIEAGQSIQWGDNITALPTARLSRLGKSELGRSTQRRPSPSCSPSPPAATTAHSISTLIDPKSPSSTNRDTPEDSEDIHYGPTRVASVRRDSSTDNLTGKVPEDNYILTRSETTHLEGSKSDIEWESPTKMPTTRGWDDCETLLSYSSKFLPVRRVKADASDLSEIIRDYEKNGVPLVIEGFHKLSSWPKEMFTLENFVNNTKSKEIDVRNIHTWQDNKMQLDEFIERCRSMGPYVMEDEQERFYGKDLDCPELWEGWLREGNVVPVTLLGNGPEDMLRYLPGSKAVQTLMCYLGIGDTFTPCHKDLCASSGQNLMCYTENNGSSFWFMTESQAAPDAAKYFQRLGHELDHENHVLTIKELSRAPFPVYVLQQKLGDLVLVPPRSCHQVHNAGGVTVKTSWSRMTCRGLSTAYFQELPIYRRLCRKETYRVKDIIYHSLFAQARELQTLFPGTSGSSSTSLPSKARRRQTDNSSIATFDETKGRTLSDSLTQLLSVYDCILIEEYDQTHEKLRHVSGDQHDTDEDIPYTCDFCGGDIFQSFFECRKCVLAFERETIGEAIHICPGCYVEGRSCECSSMRPMQYRNFSQLKDVRSDAEQAIIRFERRHNEEFEIQPLDLEVSDSVPCLFRAALQLRYIQNNAKQTHKVCTLHNSTHKSSSHWVLYCKRCHNGNCFAHILTKSKIHSSEALLIHSSEANKDHKLFHQHHLEGSQKFESGKGALKKNQEKGDRHPGYGQLVYSAMMFSKCVPFRRGLKAGWYDDELSQGEEEEEEEVDTSVSGQISHKSSTPPILINENHRSWGASDEERISPVQLPKTLKRKRLIMDYVAVPSAPYPITNVCLTRTIFSDPHNLTGTQTGQKKATLTDHEVTTTSFQADQPPDSMIKVPAATSEINNRQRQTTKEPKRISLVDLPTKRQELARLRFKKNKTAISPPPFLTENHNQNLIHTTQSLEKNNNAPGSSSHLQQDSADHKAQPLDVVSISHPAPLVGPSQLHQEPATQTSPASDLMTQSNLEEMVKSTVNQSMGVIVSSVIGHMTTTLVNLATNSRHNGQVPMALPPPALPFDAVHVPGPNNALPPNAIPWSPYPGYIPPIPPNGHYVYPYPYYNVYRGRNRGFPRPRFQPPYQGTRYRHNRHMNGYNLNGYHGYPPDHQYPFQPNLYQHNLSPPPFHPPTSGISNGRGIDSNPQLSDASMDSVDEHIRFVEQGSYQRERGPIDPPTGRDNQHSDQIASRNFPIQQATNNDTGSARSSGRSTRVDSMKSNRSLEMSHENRRSSPRAGRDTLPKNRSPRSYRHGRGSGAEDQRPHIDHSGKNKVSYVGYSRPVAQRKRSGAAVTSADERMDVDIAGASEPVFDSAMDVDLEVTDNSATRGATPMDDLPVVEPGATFPGDNPSNDHITVVGPGTTAFVDGSSSEQDWELEYTSDEIGSSIIPLSSKSSAASTDQQRSVSVASYDKVNDSSTIPSNSGIVQDDNRQDDRNISTVSCDGPNNSSGKVPPPRLSHPEDDLESMISLGEEDT